MALSKISNGGLDIGSQGFTESSKITLDAASESVTGIPDGVREIHIFHYGMSTSSATPMMRLQIGTSSGLVTSGYVCQYTFIYDSNVVGRAVSAEGFELSNWGAGIVIDGSWDLYRSNGTDDQWSCRFSSALYTDYAGQIFGTGSLDLSAPLDRVALVCANAGTFDAGTMQVLYR